LLGASGKFSGDSYAFSGVMDGTAATGVSHADVLLPLVEAILRGDDDQRVRTRTAVHEALGYEALVDAAAVIGGFDAITKVADATGIPLDARVAGPSADWRRDLGIDAFLARKV
jgi:hypothetical protein